MSSGEFNTVSVSSTLNIGKNNLIGYLNVYGKSEINGSLNVLGSMVVKSIKTTDYLILNIPTIFGSTTQFKENIEFKKDVIIEGTIKKHLSIGESVSVVGTAFLNSSVNIGSKAENTININGTSYFNTSVFLGKELTDKITVISPLFVNKGIDILGTSILNGNVKLGKSSSLNTIELLSPIINNVKFTKNIEVNTLSVNDYIKGPLKIIGETSLNGNVNLGADINSSINIIGKLSNINLSGVSNIDGITNLNGSVSLGKTLTDDIKINGTVIGPLSVSGVSRFTGSLLTLGRNIVFGAFTVFGNTNIIGKLILNGSEIKSTHHFIRVNQLPPTIIPITRIYLNNSRYGIVSGVKYKDIFRDGDKIKLDGVIYTILNSSIDALTTSNNDAGKWLFLDKPITADNKRFELFHHYVLDHTYYNIAEFFLDNSVYESQIETVYLFLPFAKESSNRPITFINRSFITDINSSGISVIVRTRGTDTINKEADSLDIGKRFTDNESTFQSKFISNVLDTWYII